MNEQAATQEPSSSETKTNRHGSAVARELWRTCEPPKDGSPIVVIGRVISRYEFATSVDPFCNAVVWLTDSSGFTGWHFWHEDSYGIHMVVASDLDDEVKIDFWLPFPSPQAASVTNIGTKLIQHAPAMFEHLKAALDRTDFGPQDWEDWNTKARQLVQEVEA